MTSIGNFTEAHDSALYEYFTGVLSGSRMGVHSSMGDQLDAMAAAVCERRDWSKNYMHVSKVHFESAGYEIDERALFAAQRMREIEAVLARMEAPDVRVLAASYAVTGPNATPAVLRLVCGADEGRELTRLLASSKADEKKCGKKLLASAQYRARVLVEKAKAAYAEAEAKDREARQAERRARFEAALAA